MIKHFAADGTVKREWPDGLHASDFEQDGKRFASVAKSNAIETVELEDGDQVGEAFVAAVASALDAAGAKPFVPAPHIPDALKETFDQAIASSLAAADVHPIEAALSAGADLPPVAIAPDPEPADIVMGTGPDAKPMIETKLGELVPAPGVSNSQKIGSALDIGHRAALEAITSVDHSPSEVVIETNLGRIVQPAEFASLPAKTIQIKTVPGSTTATFNALTPVVTTVHHLPLPLPSEVVETAAHALSDAAEVLKQEEARNASNAGALNVEPQGAQATHSTEAVQIPTVEAQHG